MKAEKSKKKIMAPVVALLATAIILAVAMAGTAQQRLISAQTSTKRISSSPVLMLR